MKWIQNPRTGELVPAALYRREAPRACADVVRDLPDYESPIDGRVVSGRAQRREDLARNHCRPYEDGEREQAERARKADDAALDARVSETVDRWWDKATSEDREALAHALREYDAKIERR
jgi:hypothetical protein